jgi:hypothetical protein
MPFTKLDEEPTRVDKVSKTGAVYYSIWLDGAGEEYVQIVDNVGGTGAGQGSFSPNLFKLEDIGQGQVPEGYDPGSGQVVPSADNNMKAFLRVAKEDRMLS